MGSNKDSEFDRSMKQLIHLLKKLVRNYPDQDQVEKMRSIFKEEGINVNFCFFNFFPVNEEEMDELEEICDQYLSDESKKPEDLAPYLSMDDVEFLRRHGIRY